MEHNKIRNHSHPAPAKKEDIVDFEIFVRHGFTELEVASIVRTLEAANAVLHQARFRWRFVSDKPGLISGRGGMIVRAEPAISDHNLAKILIIVGGTKVEHAAWSQRLSAMLQRARSVVILSEAATAFIRRSRHSEKKLTTQWPDAQVLEEWGSYPNLSMRYAETSDGITTSAGGNFTTELTIHLISHLLSHQETAELASRLVVKTIRKPQAMQPKGPSHLTNAFGPKMAKAVGLMEENIAEPLATATIAEQAGMSQRQLERHFNTLLKMSPAKYYKFVRVEKAYALVTETDMALIDIAVATGFASVSSLAIAFRAQFGVSPTQYRKEYEKSGN